MTPTQPSPPTSASSAAGFIADRTPSPIANVRFPGVTSAIHAGEFSLTVGQDQERGVVEPRGTGDARPARPARPSPIDVIPFGFGACAAIAACAAARPGPEVLEPDRRHRDHRRRVLVVTHRAPTPCLGWTTERNTAAASLSTSTRRRPSPVVVEHRAGRVQHQPDRDRGRQRRRGDRHHPFLICLGDTSRSRCRTRCARRSGGPRHPHAALRRRSHAGSGDVPVAPSGRPNPWLRMRRRSRRARPGRRDHHLRRCSTSTTCRSSEVLTSRRRPSVSSWRPARAAGAPPTSPAPHLSASDHAAGRRPALDRPGVDGRLLGVRECRERVVVARAGGRVQRRRPARRAARRRRAPRSVLGAHPRRPACCRSRRGRARRQVLAGTRRPRPAADAGRRRVEEALDAAVGRLVRVDCPSCTGPPAPRCARRRATGSREGVESQTTLLGLGFGRRATDRDRRRDRTGPTRSFARPRRPRTSRCGPRGSRSSG